MMMIYFAKT